MQNAYTRFGYLRINTKDNALRFNVERAILSEGTEPTIHFLSCFTGDSATAALRASITDQVSGQLELPTGELCKCRFVGNTLCLQSDFRIPERVHPLRHVIALSPTFMMRDNPDEVVLPSLDHHMLWKTLVYRCGIPGVPEWASYVVQRLLQDEALTHLTGINCEPICVKVDRAKILDWLSHGLRKQHIRLPEANGAIHWPTFTLEDAFNINNEESLPLAA